MRRVGLYELSERLEDFPALVPPRSVSVREYVVQVQNHDRRLHER